MVKARVRDEISIAGRGLSRSSSSAYATAKGGIIALTRKLALELGPHGITVKEEPLRGGVEAGQPTSRSPAAWSW